MARVISHELGSLSSFGVQPDGRGEQIAKLEERVGAPMIFSDRVSKWRKASARIVGLFAKPAREGEGEEGIVLKANRGYGSRTEIFLIGRVFRQSRPDGTGDPDSLLSQLRDLRHRITRRACSDMTVTARFCGTEERVTTDSDGYFRVQLKPQQSPPADTIWHKVGLSIDQPRRVTAEAEVFIPSDRCRFVVISDIDDTVMKTGVANKLTMLWRLFVEDAESREAFPGVGALYRALYSGSSGDEANPMLYVSRAPWGIYEVLEEFFVQHNIPAGPIMFLREWGVSWKWPFPRKAEDHKRDLIRHMLKLYNHLPFVLIGDSGQHDPEAYREIVDENPGRVIAVYIRNVSRSEKRIGEIEKLASAVAEAGSSLVLAADSLAMAKHAARLGLIPSEALGEVRAEAEAGAGEKQVRRKTRRVGRPTAQGAADAVMRGELRDALNEGDELPRNVEIGTSDQGQVPSQD